MEEKISQQLELIINAQQAPNSDLDGYVKASERYEKLVAQGITTKRGFNIMTTGEIYSPLLNSVLISNKPY